MSSLQGGIQTTILQEISKLQINTEIELYENIFNLVMLKQAYIIIIRLTTALNKTFKKNLFK